MIEDELGICERHLESLVQATLRQIIHVEDFPRTVIQISLQIIDTPDDDTEFKTGTTDSVGGGHGGRLVCPANVELDAGCPAGSSSDSHSGSDFGDDTHVDDVDRGVAGDSG